VTANEPVSGFLEQAGNNLGKHAWFDLLAVHGRHIDESFGFQFVAGHLDCQSCNRFTGVDHVAFIDPNLEDLAAMRACNRLLKIETALHAFNGPDLLLDLEVLIKQGEIPLNLFFQKT